MMPSTNLLTMYASSVASVNFDASLNFALIRPTLLLSHVSAALSPRSSKG